MKNSSVLFRLQFLLSLKKWMSLFSALREYGHVLLTRAEAHLEGGWYWSLFSSYICHKANPSYVQECLDLLLKDRHYNYLCNEILCAKPFFEEILFYPKGSRGLPAILEWHILTQVLWCLDRLSK